MNPTAAYKAKKDAMAVKAGAVIGKKPEAAPRPPQTFSLGAYEKDPEGLASVRAMVPTTHAHGRGATPALWRVGDTTPMGNITDIRETGLTIIPDEGDEFTLPFNSGPTLDLSYRNDDKPDPPAVKSSAIDFGYGEALRSASLPPWALSRSMLSTPSNGLGIMDALLHPPLLEDAQNEAAKQFAGADPNEGIYKDMPNDAARQDAAWADLDSYQLDPEGRGVLNATSVERDDGDSVYHTFERDDGVKVIMKEDRTTGRVTNLTRALEGL